MPRAVAHFVALLLLAAALTATGVCGNPPAPWPAIGPDGGDARSLAVDPADPDHIFLGTSAGELFASHDGGATWSRLAHLGGGDDYVLDHILIAPSGTIYVGAWSADDNYGDIFRSDDGGETWRVLQGMHGKSVRSLAMAPTDDQTLVAGALDGIYRTHDGGQTWERISPLGHLEIKNIESLAIDPRDTDVIYAGTWHLPWKTTDGGATWQSIKQGIIDDSDVFSIIIDRNDPRIVYASACSGIYKSQTAGAAFVKVQGMPFSARRTRVLQQDTLHPEVVYAGTTEGLWRTQDAGATWQRISAANAIVNDVLLDPRRPGRVLVATDRGGVLASSNGGATFAASNRGFAHRQVHTLIADASVPAVLYAGVINDKEFGGVFTSRDNGASWSQMSAGLGARDVFVLQQLSSGTLLAGTNTGIFAWTRGAKAWQLRGVLATATEEPPRPRPRRRAEAAPDQFHARIYDFELAGTRLWTATSEGLYSSDDEGKTWRGGPILGAHDVIAIRIEGETIAAVTPQQLLLSSDSGTTWSPAALPEYVTALHSIEFAPGAMWIATREGALRSFDHGESWEHVLNGLPHRDVLAVTYDAEARRLLVTAAGAVDVFESTDSGRNFHPLGAGWRVRGVLTNNGRVFGRTAHNGVIIQPAEGTMAAGAGTGAGQK